MLIASTRQGNYVTFLSQFFFSIGVFVASFAVAIPITLLCEVPFMNIEKYILFPQKKRKKNEKVEVSKDIQAPMVQKNAEVYFQTSNEETGDQRDSHLKMNK